MTVGRFAPSPTGRLHLGNLRTALVAWLAARSAEPTESGQPRFLLRFEDLDAGAVRAEHYGTQTDDLAAIGLDWDPPVIRQSERTERYDEILDRLIADDAVYPCFCSRREIREAVAAPNDRTGHAGHTYPGTCRQLSTRERSDRARTRNPALRLRADGLTRSFVDLVAGRTEVTLDDFVIRRNDGTPAYHLVVVVDDGAQGVDQVIRADDLLPSTGRHLLLYELLGLPAPDHAHVPLVLAPTGDRLAKRHGSVTLADRAALGESPAEVTRYLASTLGLCEPDETVDGRPIAPIDLLDRFRFDRLPTEPLVLDAGYLGTEEPQPTSSSETV
ncbi:MAG: tRNA glutamyl-Q(34) synthetase GluQRS [Actinomycetota bacterium]